MIPRGSSAALIRCISASSAPPRQSGVVAGPVVFGLRAVSHEDPAGSAVEEGTVEVGAFVELVRYVRNARADAGTPRGAAFAREAFARAGVRAFASSHTCLPVLQCFEGDHAVVNNGAAGMPNFRGTRYGLATRISAAPSGFGAT